MPQLPKYTYIVHIMLKALWSEPTNFTFRCDIQPEIIDGIFRVYTANKEHSFPVGDIYYDIERIKLEDKQ